MLNSRFADANASAVRLQSRVQKLVWLGFMASSRFVPFEYCIVE